VAVVLLLLLVLAVFVIVRLLVYKAGHKYTDEDIAAARKDSRDRSHAIVSGKVAEHLAPFLPGLLSKFNPRDARFLGAPLDFIIFDGLDDGGEVRRVVFVEVKTGRGSLQPRERRVREAIEARRVEYQLLRLPKEMALDAVDGIPTLDAPEAPPALQP
jgi:predicted Holliday junction resolvase-like endonuclease